MQLTGWEYRVQIRMLPCCLTTFLTEWCKIPRAEFWQSTRIILPLWMYFILFWIFTCHEYKSTLHAMKLWPQNKIMWSTSSRTFSVSSNEAKEWYRYLVNINVYKPKLQVPYNLCFSYKNLMSHIITTLASRKNSKQKPTDVLYLGSTNANHRHSTACSCPRSASTTWSFSRSQSQAQHASSLCASTIIVQITSFQQQTPRFRL